MKLIQYIIISLLVVLAACAQEPQAENAINSMPCHQMPDGSLMGHCEEGAEIMDHSMHMMPVTSEQNFLVNMIPHHQEAIDTARIIVESTEDPELRDLAQRIVDAQEQEVTMMNAWIAAWYEEEEQAMYMNMMPDLESLSGHERDDAFLEGMIPHHEMAVQMAKEVLMLEPRKEVVDFANSIIEVQHAEIEEMHEMLEHHN